MQLIDYKKNLVQQNIERDLNLYNSNKKLWKRKHRLYEVKILNETKFSFFNFSREQRLYLIKVTNRQLDLFDEKTKYGIKTYALINKVRRNIIKYLFPFFN